MGVELRSSVEIIIIMNFYWWTTEMRVKLSNQETGLT